MFRSGFCFGSSRFLAHISSIIDFDSLQLKPNKGFLGEFCGREFVILCMSDVDGERLEKQQKVRMSDFDIERLENRQRNSERVLRIVLGFKVYCLLTMFFKSPDV